MFSVSDTEHFSTEHCTSLTDMYELFETNHTTRCDSYSVRDRITFHAPSFIWEDNSLLLKTVSTYLLLHAAWIFLANLAVNPWCCLSFFSIKLCAGFPNELLTAKTQQRLFRVLICIPFCEWMRRKFVWSPRFDTRRKVESKHISTYPIVELSQLLFGLRVHSRLTVFECSLLSNESNVKSGQHIYNSP